MAGALAFWGFYILLGYFPLGIAIYLFATGKGRVGYHFFGIILLLIAILSLSAVVDVRQAAYPR